MASNIGQIGRTRTYGSDVIGGSRVNHHYVLNRYDFAGDWRDESIPIDTNILQIQWIGRVFHLCVASDILCRLHGRVGLLREKEFTFDIRLQSVADVGGHSRYVWLSVEYFTSPSSLAACCRFRRIAKSEEKAKHLQLITMCNQ